MFGTFNPTLHNHLLLHQILLWDIGDLGSPHHSFFVLDIAGILPMLRLPEPPIPCHHPFTQGRQISDSLISPVSLSLKIPHGLRAVHVVHLNYVSKEFIFLILSISVLSVDIFYQTC